MSRLHNPIVQMIELLSNYLFVVPACSDNCESCVTIGPAKCDTCDGNYTLDATTKLCGGMYHRNCNALFWAYSTWVTGTHKDMYMYPVIPVIFHRGSFLN